MLAPVYCNVKKSVLDRDSEVEPATSMASHSKFKCSLKNIFSWKRGKKETCSKLKATVVTEDVLVVGATSVIDHVRIESVIALDIHSLQALYDMYDALHSPTTLDARRHQRYGLVPRAFLEVPLPPPQASPLDIARPSCHLSFLTEDEDEDEDADFLLQEVPSYLRPTTPSVGSPISRSSVPDVRRTMDIRDMQLLQVLGEGGSGKVYHVRDRVSRVKMALKVVEKEGKPQEVLEVWAEERFMAEKLSDSPWFVNMLASWHDDANLYIAMTAYPTDLDSEIYRCGVIEPERARFYMAEIIIALNELHSRGIMHRDVKGPNILIDREGHIVLADFGLSKDFGKRPNTPERTFQPYWHFTRELERVEPDELHKLHFVVSDYRGSELEMAPEVHLHEPHSFGVDFWSAAVVLYWMLTGRAPWSEPTEEEYEDGSPVDVKPLAARITKDPLVFKNEDDVDEVTMDFLTRMLVKIPKRRLRISTQVQTHAYFSGLDWSLMEQRRVPAPWIPEDEICPNVYEPSDSPDFEPGNVYAVGADPDPNFTFISPSAAYLLAPVAENWEESESDEASSESEESVVEIVTYLDENSYYDQSGSRDLEDIGEAWDCFIIYPPSTSPCGPGPVKNWFTAQDIKSLHPLALPRSRHCPRTTLPVDEVVPEQVATPVGEHLRSASGIRIFSRLKGWLSKLWKVK